MFPYFGNFFQFNPKNPNMDFLSQNLQLRTTLCVFVSLYLLIRCLHFLTYVLHHNVQSLATEVLRSCNLNRISCLQFL